MAPLGRPSEPKQLGAEGIVMEGLDAAAVGEAVAEARPSRTATHRHAPLPAA